MPLHGTFCRFVDLKDFVLRARVNLWGKQTTVQIYLSSNRLSADLYSKKLLLPGADPGFGQGGPQLPTPKVADVAERSHASEASYLWPGSRAHLRALEGFGFLMLTYICLTSVTHAKCGIPSTLCWKIGNISGSTELFAL